MFTILQRPKRCCIQPSRYKDAQLGMRTYKARSGRALAHALSWGPEGHE